jgi:hypothetical protein
MVQGKHFKVLKATKVRAWSQIDTVQPKSLKASYIFVVEYMAREAVVVVI